MANSNISLPTRDSLSSEYGFTVPEAFVTLVRLAYGQEPNPSSGLRGLFSSLDPKPSQRDEDPHLFFEEACSLILKPNSRYQQTPPELFPIGNMGVDGVHYGYVIHTPELPRADYPMGELCPMDDDGVQLLGVDTRNAFENMLSFAMECRHESEEEFEPSEIKAFNRRVGEISRALQISPHPSKSSRRYGPDGNGLPVSPEVPTGWRHLPTADGIGVLAKQEHFLATPPAMPDPYADPAAFVDLGRQALADGFPATALAFFREGFWQNWTDRAFAGALADGMGESYRALGRPRLAEVLERNMADHRREVT